MINDSSSPRLNPSDETIKAGQVAIRFLVTGKDSNGGVAVFEFTVPAGERLMAPADSHDHYEETIYGLNRVSTFTVDSVPIDIGPGQVLCIPRGATHRYDNKGSAEVKGFCAVTPAHLVNSNVPNATESENFVNAQSPRLMQLSLKLAF